MNKRNYLLLNGILFSLYCLGMTYSIVKKTHWWWFINNADINNLFNISLPQKIFEQLLVDIYSRNPEYFTNWFLNHQEIKEILITTLDVSISPESIVENITRTQYEWYIEQKKELEFLLLVIKEFNNDKVSYTEMKSILWNHKKILDQKVIISLTTKDEINTYLKQIEPKLLHSITFRDKKLFDLETEKKKLVNEYTQDIKENLLKINWNHILYKVHIEDIWNGSCKITYPDWRSEH